MTEEKKKQLDSYVLAASVNNPVRTKAWLDYLETLSDEEKEKEIDRAFFDRGFKRFETEATMYGGIGNTRNLREFGKMVKEYKASKRPQKHFSEET